MSQTSLKYALTKQGEGSWTMTRHVESFALTSSSGESEVLRVVTDGGEKTGVAYRIRLERGQDPVVTACRIATESEIAMIGLSEAH